MSGTKRVVLIVETSSGYGRSLLRGIVRFIRAHEEWSIFLEQRDLTTEMPSWLRTWQGDGIISRSMTPWLPEMAARNRVPLVNLVDRTLEESIPSVCSDQQAIGKLAAEHLLERDYPHFAFCGYQGEAWSDGRWEGFHTRLHARGQSPLRYNSAWHGPGLRAWDVEQRELCQWVQQLPKPCGVMACNDLRARQVLDACYLTQLSVPDQVSVLGVDNDELLCELSRPALSSVIPDTRRIGYLAAEMLSQLMRGREPPKGPVRVPPLGVATRESTDSMAITDTDIAAAVRFIRQHACEGLTVQQVLQTVPLSRSALERGVRKFLDCSPQQEIRNVQLKRCKTLLRETDYPMDRIASLCGFKHAEYMHVVFKRVLNMTPGEFRRQGTGSHRIARSP